MPFHIVVGNEATAIQRQRATTQSIHVAVLMGGQ